MGFTIQSQVYQALLSFALGVCCGIFYDVLRTIRRHVGRKIMTAACDIVFSFVFFSALFLLGHTAGFGQQRIFMGLFCFLSCWLYFYTVSPIVLKIMGAIACFIAKLLSVLALPWIFSAKVIKNFCFFLKNLFYYIEKWYTINNTYRFLDSHTKH